MGRMNGAFDMQEKHTYFVSGRSSRTRLTFDDCLTRHGRHDHTELSSGLDGARYRQHFTGVSLRPLRQGFQV